MDTDTLVIEGHSSPIINAALNAPLGLYLSALYVGMRYDLTMVQVFAQEQTIVAAYLGFDHLHGIYRRGELFSIVLRADFEGLYRAVGLQERLDRKETHHPMDGLTIVVDDLAEKGISQIRDFSRFILNDIIAKEEMSLFDEVCCTGCQRPE